MTTRFGAVVALFLTGCPSSNGSDKPDGTNQPSPNASILPAPLASGAELRAGKDGGRGGIPADSAGRLLLPEAGPPEPTRPREDEALPKDPATGREATGVTLAAEWKWPDLPGAAGGPEVSNDGLKKARQKTSLAVSIDLAHLGRMRFVFDSASFPVPKGAELRAATEYYGNVLVWPDGNAYRVLMPGTLRALFAERRVDALPVSSGKIQTKGKGSYLGLETQKLELKTPVGTLALEQGTVPNIGHAGELLCRLLLDLVAADPSSSACSDTLTPLKAEYRWSKSPNPNASGAGKLQFEVTAVQRRNELPYGLVFVPPAAATFKPGELPPQAAGVLLTKDELAQFRTKAVSVAPAAREAPGEGLMAVNRTDSVRYLVLDGIPVLWLKPSSEQYVIGPLAGRYSVSWRDFLGTSVEPAKVVELPARLAIGVEPDGGAPNAP